MMVRAHDHNVDRQTHRALVMGALIDLSARYEYRKDKEF